MLGELNRLPASYFPFHLFASNTFFWWQCPDSSSYALQLIYNIEIMRLSWSLSALALTASAVSAFAPVQNQAVVARSCSALNAVATADVKAKQDATMEKMKAKDSTSAAISADVSCDLCIDIGIWAESKMMSITQGAAVSRHNTMRE